MAAFSFRRGDEATDEPSDIGAGHRRASRQGGFTLLEVLITLVLVSMVVAIVFGSLRQVVDVRARLRPYLDQSEETAKVAGWFRQTVGGLLVDYKEGHNHFVGTATKLSGLTVSPLVGPPGTPTAFHWELRYDSGKDLTVLTYKERSSNTLRIASWPGHEGSFGYYGRRREWRPDWKPPDLTEKFQDVPQLPALIRLGDIDPRLFPTIVAAPRATPIPRLRPNFLGRSLVQN